MSNGKDTVKATRYKATYPFVVGPAVIMPIASWILTKGVYFFDEDMWIIFGIGAIFAIVFGTIGHFVWWLLWRKREVELEFHNYLSLNFIGFFAGLLPSLVAMTSN